MQGELQSTLSQLSSLDLSSLLTFLDRFELVKPWDRHVEHYGEGQLAACWDLKHANPFEVAFFTKSKERLKKILASVGLQWHAVHHDKHIFLYRVEGGRREDKPLTQQEVGALVTAVEEELEKDGKFDYVSFVNQNLKAGIELISQLRPYAKDLIDEKVTPQPIEPCEAGSGMAQYEVNFQAAGTSMILYPNANKFTHEHKAFWEETASRKGRLRRDYFFACTYAVLHELIHCIQYKTMDVTSLANIWKKEYGACYAQMNIMAAVAEKEKELYPEGLPEEIVLWYLEIVRRLHHVVPPETSEAFVRWRDSRGAQVHEEYGSKYTDNLLIKDPVDKDAAIFLAENRAQGYYLKARLAIEAWDGGKTFGEFLDWHFGEEGRKSYPGNMPPAHVDTAAQDLMQILTLPIAEHEWLLQL